MNKGWNLLLVDWNNDIFFAKQVKLGCPFSNAIITIFDAKELCEKNIIYPSTRVETYFRVFSFL